MDAQPFVAPDHHALLSLDICLIFPTPYCDISPLFSSQPALLLCVHPYKSCVCYQTAEGARARSPRTKSVTLCSHLPPQNVLPSDIYTLRDMQIQKGLPRQSSPCATTHLAASSLWKVSALPPPSRPSRWTQGMRVRLATNPCPLLPWQYIPCHSRSVCNLGSPCHSADRRFH